MQARGIKMCVANSLIAATTTTELNADVEVETQEKERIKLNLFAKPNKRRKRGNKEKKEREKVRVGNERVSYKHCDVTLSSSLHSYIRSVSSNRQVSLLVILHAYTETTLTKTTNTTNGKRLEEYLAETSAPVRILLACASVDPKFLRVSATKSN